MLCTIFTTSFLRISLNLFTISQITWCCDSILFPRVLGYASKWTPTLGHVQGLGLTNKGKQNTSPLACHPCHSGPRYGQFRVVYRYTAVYPIFIHLQPRLRSYQVDYKSNYMPSIISYYIPMIYGWLLEPGVDTGVCRIPFGASHEPQSLWTHWCRARSNTWQSSNGSDLRWNFENNLRKERLPSEKTNW
jgi:hypothetical protein